MMNNNLQESVENLSIQRNILQKVQSLHLLMEVDEKNTGGSKQVNY